MIWLVTYVAMETKASPGQHNVKQDKAWAKDGSSQRGDIISEDVLDMTNVGHMQKCDGSIQIGEIFHIQCPLHELPFENTGGIMFQSVKRFSCPQDKLEFDK